jgi:mannitol-1-phosphate 5-dehydrogenase
VAEVIPEVVEALNRSLGFFTVNIAHPYRVETTTIGPIEAVNPADPSHRQRLVAAVEHAAEIATAVPSVQNYRSEGPGSIHRILAEGFSRRARGGGWPAVVYTAENHNQAAEMLREAVLEEVPVSLRDSVNGRICFLNTVIGKMSGVITDLAELRARGLAPVTRVEKRAFLVEAFNQILISTVKFNDPSAASFSRGISVFLEKPDLLPFEDAKLYGHNATHAAAGYLASLAGLRRIAQLRNLVGAMEFLRAAFIEESGAALIRRHGGVDPLFTPEGYRAYADDLLGRMTNPHLGDTTARVGRDVRRKLGWDDRLIGIVRAALAEGIRPRRYALAAAAALKILAPELAGDQPAGPFLKKIWGEIPPGPELDRVIAEVEDGRKILHRWSSEKFPDLEQLMRKSEPSRTM